MMTRVVKYKKLTHCARSFWLGLRQSLKKGGYSEGRNYCLVGIIRSVDYRIWLFKADCRWKWPWPALLHGLKFSQLRVWRCHDYNLDKDLAHLLSCDELLPCGWLSLLEKILPSAIEIPKFKFRESVYFAESDQLRCDDDRSFISMTYLLVMNLRSLVVVDLGQKCLMFWWRYNGAA